MKSMTGYGRGTAERGGRRVTVEIRSVNHRFLDVKVRGPALEPSIEDALVGRLRDKVERGAITISVRIERRAAIAARYDVDAARAAFAALRAVADDLGTPPPSLDLVVGQPGVVVVGDDGDDGALVGAVTAAADAAVAELVEMRATEGAALARDLAARAGTLVALVGELRRAADLLPQEIHRRLEERVRRLVAEADAAAVDPARLAQEVTLLADRADVTEELVRLSSHLEQLAGVIASDGSTPPATAQPEPPDNGAARVPSGTRAVGRRLDFLLQEVGRELNTIGSKSPSAEIVSRIVTAKVELEKLREQAQNVE
jgi:uncharacterized protein (TIGR00255 family)